MGREICWGRKVDVMMDDVRWVFAPKAQRFDDSIRDRGGNKGVRRK